MATMTLIPTMPICTIDNEIVTNRILRAVVMVGIVWDANISSSSRISIHFCFCHWYHHYHCCYSYQQQHPSLGTMHENENIVGRLHAHSFFPSWNYYHHRGQRGLELCSILLEMIPSSCFVVYSSSSPPP
jgi:hypothetical protein